LRLWRRSVRSLCCSLRSPLSRLLSLGSRVRRVRSWWVRFGWSGFRGPCCSVRCGSGWLSWPWARFPRRGLVVGWRWPWGSSPVSAGGSLLGSGLGRLRFWLWRRAGGFRLWWAFRFSWLVALGSAGRLRWPPRGGVPVWLFGLGAPSAVGWALGRGWLWCVGWRLALGAGWAAALVVQLNITRKGSRS